MMWVNSKNRGGACCFQTLQKNLTIACYDIAILQQSVQQKKLQLQKEKLQFKLNFIVHSQVSDSPPHLWNNIAEN